MIKDIRGGVWYKPDGTEICQQHTAAGRREYERRRYQALLDQEGICAICGNGLSERAATLDHIQPRGMGGARRNDAQSNIQATHGQCNSAKASRRTPYVITQNSC